MAESCYNARVKIPRMPLYYRVGAHYGWWTPEKAKQENNRRQEVWKEAAKKGQDQVLTQVANFMEEFDETKQMDVLVKRLRELLRP